MKVGLIIPAGGQGKRMGHDRPKQYLELKGQPILWHTLKVFQESASIDSIVLAVSQNDVAEIREQYQNDFAKIHQVTAGGKERQDSVYNGFLALSPDVELVMVHDAVRPFVDATMIAEVVKSAERTGGAIVAIPLSDTLKRADAEGKVAETIPRDKLWRVQTPQVFRRDIFAEAYEKAIADGFYGTDEASLVERLGIKIAIAQGSAFNIKITHPEDLILGQAILQHSLSGNDQAVQ